LFFGGRRRCFDLEVLTGANDRQEAGSEFFQRESLGPLKPAVNDATMGKHDRKREKKPEQVRHTSQKLQEMEGTRQFIGIKEISA
jgi:hypothetical protein